jgi:hypothetical protein
MYPWIHRQTFKSRDIQHQEIGISASKATERKYISKATTLLKNGAQGILTSIGTPLHQRIDALLYAHKSVVTIYTNGSDMRCRWWRCKGLQQHIYMRW